jgi:hypothetical protein
MVKVAKRVGARHCEEQSDEAIQSASEAVLDCFATLAMTSDSRVPVYPRCASRLSASSSTRPNSVISAR